MKYIFYALVLCSMAACQYFETDKISSDTFYDQELKTISWNQVDQFPNFVSCQKYSDKKVSKTCFENTLISNIYKGLSSKHLVSSRSIKDTIWVSLTVSEKGDIFLNTIAIDSLTATSFPELVQLPELCLEFFQDYSTYYGYIRSFLCQYSVV